MKRLLTLLIALVFVAGCATSSGSNPTLRQEAEWVRTHQARVSLLPADAPKALGLLEPDLATHAVFLTGETHGVDLNFRVLYTFLVYLNQHANVTYNLAELPWSYAQELNRYLRMGDEGLLADLGRLGRGSALGTKEALAFWRQLYAYNQGLPVARRIEVIGVDGELDAATAFFHLRHLLPSAPPPTTIAPLIEPIARSAIGPNPYDYRYGEEAVALQRALASGLSEAEPIYRAYLGPNFTDFAFTVRNMGAGIALQRLLDSGSPRFFSEREHQFEWNFKALWPSLSRGKFYGQWGAIHIIQKRFRAPEYGDFGQPYAAWLNAFPPTRGKVLSIPILYLNSKRLINGPAGATEPVHENLPGGRLLEAASHHAAALFKLTGPGSPFNQVFTFWPNGSGGGTTEYFQYVLMVRNGRPLTPIRWDEKEGGTR